MMDFKVIINHFNSDYINEKYVEKDKVKDKPKIYKKMKDINTASSRAIEEFKKLEKEISLNENLEIKKAHNMWQIGGSLRKYFWVEIINKKQTNTRSSISIFFDKTGLKCLIEFFSKDKTDEELKKHNEYLVRLSQVDYVNELENMKYWRKDKIGPEDTCYEVKDMSKDLEDIINQTSKYDTLQVGDLLKNEEINNMKDADVIEWINIKVEELYPYYTNCFGDDSIQYDSSDGNNYESDEANIKENNEEEYIGCIKINTPNNRCKDETSFVGQNGNYEARMHVYAHKNKKNDCKEVEKFFNQFDSNNVYTFDKENLISYLNTFKFEFEFQILNKYNNVSLDYWNKQLCKVKKLTEQDVMFNIDNHKLDSKNIYYIGSSDNIFSNLKGHLLLPKITSINIYKYLNNTNNKYKYIFKIETADEYEKVVECINKTIVELQGKHNIINNDGKKEIKEINFEEYFQIKDLYYKNKLVIEKQINKSLKSGKNIILVGPPGTGKSKLSKQICEHYGVRYNMTTAISDWSTYETVGGYKLDKDSSLYFDPGIFLNCFKDSKNEVKNEWLIIDEMNRADIDKAFGTFFSTLSGDSVNLSFKDDSGKNIEIINEKDIPDIKSVKSNQYIIPSDWRLIGSINTFDKTSLFEMSYAFMRRFAFIPISIPKSIDVKIVEEYLECWKINNIVMGTSSLANGLKEIWTKINKYRQIGPAIIRDIAKYVQDQEDWASAITLYILPQFEGVQEDKLKEFVDELLKTNIEGLESGKDIINTFIEDFFGISV